MNFFEGELRQMFGKLGDDLLVKAQFISTHVSKQYDAIQVSILNRSSYGHIVGKIIGFDRHVYFNTLILCRGHIGIFSHLNLRTT